MFNESTHQAFEKKEKEKFKHIKVFRVRHGNTSYYEQLKGLPGDIIDLTEQGIKEMESAAEKIASNINKEEDIVSFGYSPRKRTIDTANIIKKHLKKEGFTIWEDPKNREEQERVRSTDIMNDDNEAISHKELEYVPAVQELLSIIKDEVPEGETATKYWKEGNIDALEKPDSVDSRSKAQLAKLMRIAHTIQPKIDKRLVIIQTEHEETLDDMLLKVSDGENGVTLGSGPHTGEVFELDIPVDTSDDEINVKSLTRDIKTKPIHFDYLKREYKDESK